MWGRKTDQEQAQPHDHEKDARLSRLRTEFNSAKRTVDPAGPLAERLSAVERRLLQIEEQTEKDEWS